MASVSLLVAALAAGACNIVAGLDQFHPATDATTSTTGGGSAGGGGASTSSTVGDVSTSTSSSPVSSSSTGSGSACADHLLLNEVHLHDDFVELFNPTTSSIPLSEIKIYALTSGGAFDVKWNGLGSTKMIKPGAYFLIVEDAAKFGNEDDVLSNGISDSKDPTVVVVTDQSDAIIDSVCVCSAPGCSQVFGVDVCVGRSLPAPGFQADLTDGASRQSCKDTNDDGVDFAVACATPRTENDSIACP
ncbi:MAG: hypothetical protein U0414_20845 [Polyangiaceae bacterium]